MEPNITQGERPPLPQRVRSAKLPPPADRARIRRDAGASLRDFGTELGVSPMTVGRWESGVVHPRLDQAAAYARLLADVEAAINAPTVEGDSA